MGCFKSSSGYLICSCLRYFFERRRKNYLEDFFVRLSGPIFSVSEKFYFFLTEAKVAEVLSFISRGPFSFPPIVLSSNRTHPPRPTPRHRAHPHPRVLPQAWPIMIPAVRLKVELLRKTDPTPTPTPSSGPGIYFCYEQIVVRSVCVQISSQTSHSMLFILVL